MFNTFAQECLTPSLESIIREFRVNPVGVEDHRQAVERQRNPCNTEPSQTGNPEGVTDTISRHYVSLAACTLHFPALLCCPVGQGLRPCLYSVALSGLG